MHLVCTLAKDLAKMKAYQERHAQISIFEWLDSVLSVLENC